MNAGYLRRLSSSPNVLAYIALLLLMVFPASAQWEHIGEDNEGDIFGKRSPSSPHPLQFYLSPLSHRDLLDTPCPKCTANNDQNASVQGLSPETSTHVIGKFLGKNIFLSCRKRVRGQTDTTHGETPG